MPAKQTLNALTQGVDPDRSREYNGQSKSTQNVHKFTLRAAGWPKTCLLEWHANGTRGEMARSCGHFNPPQEELSWIGRRDSELRRSCG